MSNIQKAFKNKAKRGLCMASGGFLGSARDALPTSMSTGATSYGGGPGSDVNRNPAQPVQAAPALGQAPQPVAAPIPSAMRDMASLGGESPVAGEGHGAQHNWLTQSASDLQAGNPRYRAGSDMDPHASGGFSMPAQAPVRPTGYAGYTAPSAIPTLAPLPTMAGEARRGLRMADGGVVGILANRGKVIDDAVNTATGAPAPAPVAPPPAPSAGSQADSYAAQAEALERQSAAAAAAKLLPQKPKGLMSRLGFASGGVIMPVQGEGGPREDKVPVVLAGRNVNVSDGEKVAVIPAKTAQNPEAMDAITDIMEATNDGRTPRRGLSGGGQYAPGSTPLPPAIGEGLTNDELRTKLQSPQGSTIRNLQAERVNARVAAPAPVAPPAPVAVADPAFDAEVRARAAAARAPRPPVAPSAAPMIEPIDPAQIKTAAAPEAPKSTWQKAKAVTADAGRSIKSTAQNMMRAAPVEPPPKWYQPSAGVKRAAGAVRGTAGFAAEKLLPTAIALGGTASAVDGLNNQANRSVDQIDERGGFLASSVKDAFPNLAGVGEEIGNYAGRISTAISGGINPNNQQRESLLTALRNRHDGRVGMRAAAARNEADLAGTATAPPVAAAPTAATASAAPTPEQAAATEQAAIAAQGEELQSRGINAGKLMDTAQSGMRFPGGKDALNAVKRGNVGLRSLANNATVRGDFNASHQEQGDNIAAHVTTTPDGRTQTMLTGGAPTKAQYLDVDGKPTNDWYSTPQYAESQRVNAANDHALKTISGYNTEAMLKSNNPLDREKGGLMAAQRAQQDATAAAERQNATANRGIERGFEAQMYGHNVSLLNKNQEMRWNMMQQQATRNADMLDSIHGKMFDKEGNVNPARAEAEDQFNAVLAQNGLHPGMVNTNQMREHLSNARIEKSSRSGTLGKAWGKITGRPEITGGNPGDYKVESATPSIIGGQLIRRAGRATPSFSANEIGDGFFGSINADDLTNLNKQRRQLMKEAK